MAKTQIDIDSMFFGMLAFVAQRSTCTRADVGAVLVRDRRPISMGYNGAPPGMPHCFDVGCEQEIGRGQNTATGFGVQVELEGCARTVHAEANAIAFAARNGIATEGATMYCTHAPCYSCAKLMVSAGILEFKYQKEYRDERGRDLLVAAGVTVTKYV
jgi:dCMP deaminase